MEIDVPPLADRCPRTEDLALWLPYTQMRTAPYPRKIAAARGAVLIDEEGRELIDGISSWWVTTHGHCHPRLIAALTAAVEQLDQVMFAGFVHEPALRLAETLLTHLPAQTRLFLSDNGSTAVEAALKMAIQFWRNQGRERTTFVAFENCYHGETFGAMSLGRGGVYSEPFDPLLFHVVKIPVPTPGHELRSREALDRVLAQYSVAAVIYEPILQGAGGMEIYSPAGLEEILALAKERGVLCIADEVAVGFGRLGRWFGSDFCRTRPDIMCFSKGLTGGTIALGATTASEEIYQAFLSDDRRSMLLHGHSFAGNPIACAVALASLELMREEGTWANIRRISDAQHRFTDRIAVHPSVRGARHIGTIAAFEIAAREDRGYFHSLRDALYREFLARNVLLRPLGNTIYIMPPYCMSDDQIARVYEVVEEVLNLVAEGKL